MNDTDHPVSDGIPILIGVGQASERIGKAGYRQLSPMDLAGEALRAAIRDSGAVAELAAQGDPVGRTILLSSGEHGRNHFTFS